MKAEISIEADNRQGLKAALWAIYEVIAKGNQPVGGTRPRSRGEFYDYDFIVRGGSFFADQSREPDRQLRLNL